MNENFLITGVGGQGTVLTSRLLAQAAILQGRYAGTSETIGMAQRGGCVTSHVRLDQPGCSPIIPQGKADVILAFEPAEACRCLGYLKPGGAVLANRRAVMPVTCAMGSGYRPQEMLETLQNNVQRLILVDGEALCRACGSAKTLNVALLGAASAAGFVPFTLQELKAVVHSMLPQRFHDMNDAALDIGAETIQGGCSK